MCYYEIIEKLSLGPWWGEFLRSNPSLSLPYHNCQHTIYMIDDSYAGAMAEGLAPRDDSPVLKAHILAAMFHDWGHSGGRVHLNPKLRDSDMGPGISDPIPDSENIKVAVGKVHDLLMQGFWPCGVSLDMVIKGIQATQFPYVIPASELNLSGCILRDADMMSSWKTSLLPHVLVGLSIESGVELRTFMASNPVFIKALTPLTDWGKQERDAHLARCLAECEFNVQAWDAGISD